MEDVVTLIAVTVVRQDGKRYLPGAPFMAFATPGGELKALGAARDPLPGEIKLADLAPLAELRIIAIADAVSMKLGEDDWTQAGTPKVASLAAHLDFMPTVAEAARFNRLG